MGGSVGVIYQQFALVLSVSILFSGFLALTLTPALCAALLKPFDPTRRVPGFNRHFDRLTAHYERVAGTWVRRGTRSVCLYLLLLAVLVLAYHRLPSSFIPSEDQGYTVTDIQLPPAASAARTEVTVNAWEQYALAQPATHQVLSILGFSFGRGANAALSYISLKDWSVRGSDQASRAVAQRATRAFEDVSDGSVFSTVPPAVDGLGTSAGFELRLQDLTGHPHAELLGARAQLLAAAKASP